MKQFCELTKPISNDLNSSKQISITNTSLQKTCNNNNTKTDKSKKSEELRLSMTNYLPEDNKSLKIENMSTNSQQDLTMNNANFHEIKVNFYLYLFIFCVFFSNVLSKERRKYSLQV